MTRRGKGYALDFLLREIKLRGHGRFDGYIVLDADNVLDRDFILHMNETFSAGHDIVTCYRSSKNYGDNWISAGYALWFCASRAISTVHAHASAQAAAYPGQAFCSHRPCLTRRAADGRSTC